MINNSRTAAGSHDGALYKVLPFSDRKLNYYKNKRIKGRVTAFIYPCPEQAYYDYPPKERGYCGNRELK